MKLLLPDSSRLLAVTISSFSNRSHGERFQTTGGSHIGTNDFFIACRLKANEKEVEKLEADKKKRLEMKKLQDAAKAVLAKGAAVNSLDRTELTALLKWHGIKGKAMPFNNSGKKAMWQVILDSKGDPPAFEEWTEVDEAKLEKLKSIDIDMNDE